MIYLFHIHFFVCVFIRLEEALNALKSSLIFTPGPIIFHIFTEDHLREQFNEKVSDLISVNIWRK
jgi:hypothetical protein